MTAMPDFAAGTVSSWMNFRHPYAQQISSSLPTPNSIAAFSPMSAMLTCLRFNRNEPPARPTRRGGPWSTAILRSSSSRLFLRVGNVLGGVIREVDHHLRSIDFKT